MSDPEPVIIPPPVVESPPVAPPAPPVAPPAPPVAPPAPEGMTEEQIKKFEESTGLNRKQLTSVAVMIQESRKDTIAAPAVVEVIEEKTLEKARGALKAAGVKEISSELETKV